jgi:hypothetical protein
MGFYVRGKGKLASRTRCKNLLSIAGAEDLSPSPWSAIRSTRLVSKPGLVPESRLVSEAGLSSIAGLVLSTPSLPVAGRARTAGTSARHRARRGRKHELPQLVLVLIFIDLDAGTLVRAGDTGDGADLIAAAGDGRRGGLARTG